MVNKRETGSRYEKLAAAYLTKAGYVILEKNFRGRQGEIDLVARDGSYLVFIEVKYRADGAMGDPLEAVGPLKQQHIRRTAAWYLCRRGLPGDTPCRFDVVGITGGSVQLVKDAF